MATVNGEERRDADGASIAELLAREGFDPGRVACELNGEIVPPGAYASAILDADDALEVVRFVGGG